MSAPCGFIRDGYLKDGFISESSFYPAMSFQYRPMLKAEYVALMRRITETDKPDPNGKTDKSVVIGEKLAQAELVERVKTWDLRDDKGALVTISVDNMARVEQHLVGKLFEVVTGMIPSDKKETDEAEPKVADEEADTKN